jgi:hypothetical protein
MRRINSNAFAEYVPQEPLTPINYTQTIHYQPHTPTSNTKLTHHQSANSPVQHIPLLKGNWRHLHG